jgi:hypothetical protein
VASRFEVDGALLSDSPPAEAAAKRIELVTSLLAQTRSEFLESHGRRRAATAGPRPILARMVMSGTPKEIAALVRRIQSLVTECAPQGDAECLSAPRGQYVLTLVGYALPDGRDKTAAEPQAP